MSIAPATKRFGDLVLPMREQAGFRSISWTPGLDRSNPVSTDRIEATQMLDKVACETLWRDAFSHAEDRESKALAWARGIGPHTFRRMRSRMFLRHYCFVVYASGFKYRTIKACFPRLEEAFKDFDLERLGRMRSLKPVLDVFGNERKARNFLTGSKAIGLEGFGTFKRRVEQGGPDTLMELPGIGPTTKDHLAKNIGLSDVAKPDVWLVRIAAICGAGSVNELVDFLHHETGETRHVIDVVLWMYARDGHLPVSDGAPSATIDCKVDNRRRGGRKWVCAG